MSKVTITLEVQQLNLLDELLADYANDLADAGEDKDEYQEIVDLLEAIRGSKKYKRK